MRLKQRDSGVPIGPRASGGQRRRRSDRGETKTGLLDAVARGLRDRTKPWHPLAAWAESRAGVDRLKLFAAAAFALAAYLLKGGPGSAVLGDAVAFLYPAYATVAAAVTRDDGRPSAAAADRRRRWLTYWTTLVTVLAAERLLGPVLSAVVPGYAMTRCVFFVWCYAPGDKNGADFVRAAVVRCLWPAGRDDRR